jgi:hypothetical protein
LPALADIWPFTILEKVGKSSGSGGMDAFKMVGWPKGIHRVGIESVRSLLSNRDIRE